MKHAKQSSKWRRGVETVVSIIAVVVSILAMIVSFSTMQLTRDANEIETRSEIRLSSSYVSIAWNQSGMLIDAANYSSDLDASKEHSDTLTIPSVVLANVGKGAALDVELDWRVAANLDSLARLTRITSSVSEPFQDGSIEVRLVVGSEGMNYSMDETEYLAFIQEEEDQRITFPAVYLEALAFFCFNELPYAENGVDVSRAFREIEMPSIEVDISRRSVVGQVFTDRTEIRFEVIHYEKNNDASGNCMMKLDMRVLGQ
ncbi:hypothetical protein [uncultured Adlercreutzia sp.]|uniref:hypothetical protein n=1 Tax=uncultured Adlercreutzia sp. TaxID=875803 RepID=UPI0025ED0651|nr:hypothetical protein [uncultured Adlercreutzia sp.]